MNLLALLSLSLALMTCRLTWSAYNFVFDDMEQENKHAIPKQCECTCADLAHERNDLRTVVRYTGEKIQESCSCQNFLIPKMRRFLLSINANETCQICKCGYKKDDECEKSKPIPLITIFDIVMVTVVCLTIASALTTLLLFARSRESVILNKYDELDHQEHRLRRVIRKLEHFFREHSFWNYKNSEAPRPSMVSVAKYHVVDEPKNDYKTFNNEP